MLTAGKRFLAAAGITAAIALAVAVVSLFFDRGEIAPPDPQTPRIEKHFGWLGPDAVEQARPIVEAMPDFRLIPEFPGVVQDNSRKNVRLWEAVKKVNGGKHLRNVRQEIGDCVSWGYRNAVTYLLAVAVATGEASHFEDVYPPYIYGTSRVQVGGGRLSGDGSLGAWASKAVNVYGVLAAESEGVPPYSGSIARQWGRRGPPQKFLDVAEEFKVETVSLITTPDQARDAICNGYPVPICSQFGSNNFYRHDGRMVARGDASWSHCMCLVAYDGSASQPYFYVLNSWGSDWGPTPLQGEPPGGFWITWNQCARILRGRDSFALSNFKGFRTRELDFNLIRGDHHELVDGDGRGDGDHADGRNRINPVEARRPAGTDAAARIVLVDPGGARDGGRGQSGRLGYLVRACGHDGSAEGGESLGLGDRPGRGAAAASPLFHRAELRALRAVYGGDDYPVAPIGLADWTVAAGTDPDCGCGGLSGCRCGILCDCVADVCCAVGGAGDGAANGGDLGEGGGQPVQRHGVFGPSQQQLRELADRAVDRAVGAGVEEIAKHKDAIVSVGCTAAGLGGVVAAALVLIARACMVVVDRLTRDRDDRDAG